MGQFEDTEQESTRLLRYAITDWTRLATSPGARLALCRECAQRWADGGVDFVQLREKTIPAGEVLELAEAFLEERREDNWNTRLLVNSRVDIAVATGADGVHLTSAAGELTVEQVRRVFATAGRPRPVVSVSCHSLEDVSRARDAGADLVLFGPVFEKVVDGWAVAKGSGLGILARAVKAAGDVPVLALGGVTKENTAACLSAGVHGVASIRLFAKQSWSRHPSLRG